MKKLSILIWMAMLTGIAILLGNCEGNTYIKPKTQELNISESIIVEFIDEAISRSTMGLGYEVFELGNLANKLFAISGSYSNCGSKVDSTIVYVYADEANTLGYGGRCDWTALCSPAFTIAAIEFNMSLL